MRIPDVEGLKDAHEAASTTNSTVLEPQETNDTNTTENAALSTSQLDGVDFASALLSTTNSTSGPAPTQTNVQAEGILLLNERQSSGCPRGQAFYKCGNGFTGCCSVNPCNPGSSCPDGQKADDQGATTTGKAGGGETLATATGTGVRGGNGGVRTRTSQTRDSTATRTRTRTTNEATSTTTGIRTASPTGSLASTTSRRILRPTASPAPNCPRANGKTYQDGFKISYRIRCNSDNAFDSFDSIVVGTGGYDQCFSSCSQSEKCAGFTYVGEDSGNCYLKAQMPNGTYEAKPGGNYISCAKLDPDAHAGTDPAGMKEPSKKPIGAIVGGVIGGLVFLGLLILLIALCAKRRRKKIEEKRKATVTHVLHGPIETDMTQRQAQQGGYQPVYAPGYRPAYGQGQGHQRQGSTSHDVFTPYGGFYRGTADLTADQRAQGMTANEARGQCSPPGGPAVIATLPASVYRAPAAVNTSSTEPVAILDSTPISRASGGSRSPRFREHLPEMEDTSPSQHYPSAPPPALTRITIPSTDSPTLSRLAQFPQQPSLADDFRRKQHLMSWNNYDSSHAHSFVGEGEAQMEATMLPKTPPATARSPHQVSPDTEPGPSDGRFLVSPFGSLDKGSK